MAVFWQLSFYVQGRRSGSGCCLLDRIVLLICIGWILNLSGKGSLAVSAAPAPVIDKEGWANPSNDNHNHRANDAILVTDHDNPPGDKIETDPGPAAAILDSGSPPELILPDFLHHTTDNRNHYNDNHYSKMNLSLISNEIPEIEYEPGLLFRCAAKGFPRPNLTWELDEHAHLPLYAIMTALKYSENDPPSDDDHQNPDNIGKNDADEEYWVDLRLPKLNNAFYGRLRCKASNLFGNRTWEVDLIHNANSSLFMKTVRIILSVVLVLVGILLIKLTFWLNAKHKERLYEKLPPQDLEIINKFKKGLTPPPPSPCSSIVDTNVIGSCIGAGSSSPGIEITVTGENPGENNIINQGGGYRLVKEESSSPDLSKRLLVIPPGGGNDGTSTPTSCKSVHVLDSVNNWTNYVPYDDKLETSSQHFKVDFANIIENGSYGMVFGGKVRNDLTMEWSPVSVKSGKTERDDNFLLESLLTELKILASLPKPHFSIVNLRGAYTKMLYKRQAYIFVDFCENGNLAGFIDLNRKNFQVYGSNQDLNTNSSLQTLPPLISSSNNNSVSSNGLVMKNLPVSHHSHPDAILPSTSKEDVIISIAVEGDKAKGSKDVKQEVAGGGCFGLKELLTWSWQIADGMNFLHRNRVIHGNLSTANVYLTAGLSAKIGNIGLTPSEQSAQCIDETTKKWLTVPNFGYEHFSKKSDIWDYGRILWEIFSLRDQQIPDKATILNFLRTEEEQEVDEDEGEIEIPDYATSEVFELMLCCWNENSTLSPEFDFLARAFRQMIRNNFTIVTASARETSHKMRISATTVNDGAATEIVTV